MTGHTDEEARALNRAMHPPVREPLNLTQVLSDVTPEEYALVAHLRYFNEHDTAVCRLCHAMSDASKAEADLRRVRTAVGNASMTRIEPGELTANISVRLLREALA